MVQRAEKNNTPAANSAAGMRMLSKVFGKSSRKWKRQFSLVIPSIAREKDGADWK